ncbi:MAG: hypothetical protein M3Y22_03580, partial [Pseudomonadota bacterium]|nr:hypothetical protein [Pseudomonadota bacterium]
MTPESRIVVFGAGAVGYYLGGKLAQAGHAVTLIGRPRLAAALAAHPLTIIEPEGTATADVKAETSTEHVPPAHLVLLTMRTYDVPGAIPLLPALLDEAGYLIAFQNGVGTDERLTTALGRERLLAGTLTTAVGMDEPGVPRPGGSGGVALAALDDRGVPADIVSLFLSTGLTANTVDDVRSLRWSKLLLNMLGAASSAVLDLDLKQVVGDPRL